MGVDCVRWSPPDLPRKYSWSQRDGLPNGGSKGVAGLWFRVWGFEGLGLQGFGFGFGALKV